MKLQELLDMKVGDLLQQYCVLYSPECGYTYGISTWDDSSAMFDLFDLEDEYCFNQDPIFPHLWEVDAEDKVLDYDDCVKILEKLGIEYKKKSSENE